MHPSNQEISSLFLGFPKNVSIFVQQIGRSVAFLQFVFVPLRRTEMQTVRVKFGIVTVFQRPTLYPHSLLHPVSADIFYPRPHDLPEASESPKEANRYGFLRRRGYSSPPYGDSPQEKQSTQGTPCKGAIQGRAERLLAGCMGGQDLNARFPCNS